jgi:NTE family protein
LHSGLRIGLSLSGGGSRAIAFHLGCLRALHDLSILDRVDTLSCVSGGSVIGAAWAYSPGKSFEDFDFQMRAQLRRGFQLGMLGELIKPHRAVPMAASAVVWPIQDLYSKITTREPPLRRAYSRTQLLETVLADRLFERLTVTSSRRHNLRVVIGACELRTGSAFRFGSEFSGGWRYGKLFENEIPLATAVAASCAHPVALPAIDVEYEFETARGKLERRRVLLADGGLYDNLGLQVLEPGHEAAYNLHSHPCEYIICCNAGRGQDSGESLPIGWARRVPRCFELLHRRMQEISVHHLHELAQSGQIKGFAMPYLGQQDANLPWKADGFVRREQVVGYDTDFEAMSDQWIETLSQRGEQLTRILMERYLPQLVGARG